jgi:MYXO-CTERM domain-containing protein
MNRSTVALVVIAAMSGACSSKSPTGEASAAQIAAFEAKVVKKQPLKRTSLIADPAKTKGQFTANPFALSDGVTPQLNYYGGPMLESVEIYAVFWGPNVDATTASSVPGMLTTVPGAGSPYMSMLQMYNATTPYTIGNGTYKGSVTDVDAPLPASGMLDDSTIQGEIGRLIDIGQLPPNNGHNIYIVYFPLMSGTNPLVITQPGGAQSCTDFCAYHGTYTRNGSNVYYGVMPDLSDAGSCGNGDCGGDTALNNLYATTSHELTEAITDAAVGLAFQFGPPLAWYDPQLGDNEIGDICAYIDDTSGGYHVQTEWLNAPVNGCSAHPATLTPDSLAWSNSTGNFIVAPSGGSSDGLATIKVTGGAGAVQLSVSPDFSSFGIVPTFTPATITPGGADTATLQYTVQAGFVTQGPFQIQIQGLDADGITHLLKPVLVIQGPAPTITSLTPNTGGTQGGNTVAVVGTKFGNPVKVTLKGAGDPPAGIPVTATRNSSTSLTLTMPGHVAGAVTLTVANLDGASASKPYTYTAGAAPTVTAVSPASGPFAGGQTVTVTGTNFSSTSTMTFGGVAMDCDNASPSQNCQFTSATSATVFSTPSFQGGANPVAISVKNVDLQTGTSAPIYTYAANTTPPVITTLSTTMGPTIGGTYVTIYGSNFGSPTTVKFGGAPATVTTSNNGFLGVFTPAHAAGAVNVVVINPDGETATAGMQFTYVAAGPPTITGINPSFGAPAGGDAVVITGTGFASDAGVTFGGSTAFVHPGNTATQLTVTTPAHAGGTVTVIVKNGDGQQATTSFLYGIPDMAIPLDMTVIHDLAIPPDMTLPSDMTVIVHDMAVAPDLSAAPEDMATGGEDLATGGGGGGGGGGTGGTGGGGGGGGHSGCSAATGSANAPTTALPLMGLALLGFALRRRTRRS